MFEKTGDYLTPWVFNRGIPILAVLLGALFLVRFSDALVQWLFLHFSKREKDIAKAGPSQRRNTLIRIFQSAFKSILWTVALVYASSEAGISITPILAAAGAAGLAIGFGGQYLARDLITGFFITLENQYRVGDYVCFDKTCGYVESFSLRLTTLRDFDGTVYHVPNGSVTRAANFSKDFSRVYLDFVVSYDNDLPKVIEMVNAVGKELAEDASWKAKVRSAPRFLRVDNFSDPGMTIKIIGTTVPGRQWDVSGELRMRLKIAADKDGIHLPRNFGFYTPQQVALKEPQDKKPRKQKVEEQEVIE